MCVVHGEERKGVTAHTGGEVKLCKACWGSKNKPAACCRYFVHGHKWVENGGPMGKAD